MSKETSTTLPTNLNPLHDSPAVAERFGVTTNTLAIWRHKGTGPKYVKLSRRCIRYRESALLNYEHACEVA